MRTLLDKSSYRGVALAVGIVLFAVPGAQAQATDITGRIFLHVNGTNQDGTGEFRESLRFTTYSEQATIDSVHDIDGGGSIDVGGYIGVWRGLAIGATYTQLTTDDSTRVTGSVPHPLLFNAFRQTAPESLVLRHEKRVTHVQAGWIVPIVDRVEMWLVGGLSFFHVTQGVIVDVELSETGPPFTLVDVGAIRTQEQTATAVGVNAGVDVAYLITEQIGVGGFLRYADGSADLPTPGGDASISLGGLQVGAGVRVRFKLRR